MNLAELRKKKADEVWANFDPHEDWDIPNESEITRISDWKTMNWEDVLYRLYYYSSPVKDPSLDKIELFNVFAITFDDEVTVLDKDANADWVRFELEIEKI